MKQDLGRLVKQITLLFTLFLFGSLSTSAQEKVHDTTRLSSFEKIDSVSFRNVYWALKTNALYDVALVPNVGVEITWVNNGVWWGTGCMLGGAIVARTISGVFMEVMWKHADGWVVNLPVVFCKVII